MTQTPLIHTVRFLTSSRAFTRTCHKMRNKQLDNFLARRIIPPTWLVSKHMPNKLMIISLLNENELIAQSPYTTLD